MWDHFWRGPDWGLFVRGQPEPFFEAWPGPQEFPKSVGACGLRWLRFWLCGGCGKVYWEGKMFVKAGVGARRVPFFDLEVDLNPGVSL